MFAYDKYPIMRGHMLIIPKRHVEDMIGLDAEEWESLRQLKDEALPVALKRYCGESISYNVAMQVGENSGREINHLHMHILPRVADDQFSGSPRKLYSAILGRSEKRDSSGVEEEVKALRKLFRYKPEKQ
jgi:diadenosine tetraphosphate (Ap4A) HIT family hydrolase